MSRLPKFLTKLSPIGETLSSLESGEALLEEEVQLHNGQLSVSSAESGLSLWESDYGLSHLGSIAARRSRIQATLMGERTLTVEALKELAVSLGGADEGVVKEFPSRHQVILSALFHNREPEDLNALKEAVMRRKPAHLSVDVLSVLPEPEIVYYGTATPLQAPRSAVCATNLGPYALFAGGFCGGGVMSSVTDAYDARLIRHAPAALPTPNGGGGVARAGNYAIFAGGISSGYTPALGTAYDTTLTQSSNENWTIPRVQRVGATSSAHHAIFGAGEISSNVFSAATDAFDETLVKSAPAPFATARGYYGATFINGHAIFAGGHTASSPTSETEAYGPDLEKLMLTSLSFVTYSPGAANTKKYALIVGGQAASKVLSTANAYSEELTRVIAPSLSVERQHPLGGSILDLALFAGGQCSNGEATSVVDCYDDDLTHTTQSNLSIPREIHSSASLCGATVDNFLLFGGGQDGATYYDTVDVYKAI